MKKQRVFVLALVALMVCTIAGLVMAGTSAAPAYGPGPGPYTPWLGSLEFPFLTGCAPHVAARKCPNGILTAEGHYTGGMPTGTWVQGKIQHPYDPGNQYELMGPVQSTSGGAFMLQHNSGPQCWSNHQLQQFCVRYYYYFPRPTIAPPPYPTPDFWGGWSWTEWKCSDPSWGNWYFRSCEQLHPN